MDWRQNSRRILSQQLLDRCLTTGMTKSGQTNLCLLGGGLLLNMPIQADLTFQALEGTDLNPAAIIDFTLEMNHK